jgi:hypothetical protein
VFRLVLYLVSIFVFWFFGFGLMVGGFPQQGFAQPGFFPNNEWGPGMVNYPIMMGQIGYPPNPMIDQGGPHGLKRQRDG